jgi:hypothetical protein
VLHFFDAGTSNTRTVYSNYGLSTALGVTVTCDSGGFPTSDGNSKVEVYTGTSPYKVTLKNSAGTTQWSLDNVVGALDTAPFAAAAFAKLDTDCSADTANTTLTTDDLGTTRNGNPTGGTFTYTLPSAITATNGRGVTVRHVGTANYLIIATVSAQTIDGQSTLELHRKYDSVTLVSDGANWHVLNDAARGYADGQCILTLSGGSLLLSPCDGNQLRAPDYPMFIQAAGASLAVSGLSTSTLYYIYAYAVVGGVAIEASATAYTTDSFTGLRIKTGDRTRRLVGMAYITSGGAFADSLTQRFVRSYFNDPGVTLNNAFIANRSKSNGTFVEIDSEIRIEWINWTGELVRLWSNGTISMGGSAGAFAVTSLAIDDTTAEDTRQQFTVATSASTGSYSCGVELASLTEGHHFATLIGHTDGNSGSWIGSASAGTRCALKASMRR